MSEAHICFERISDAFPAGDVLAEWIVTVGIAANDFAIIRDWIDEPDEPARKHPYLFRVALSHFFEIGKYLALRQSDPSITGFVASLEAAEARGYEAVLDTYARFTPTLATVRDNSAFHYGPTKIESKNPLIRRALRVVAGDPGLVSVSDQAVVHFGFAGEVAAAIVVLSCGGTSPESGEFEALMTEVGGAVTDFQDFAEAAVRRFLSESGIPLEVLTTR
jgi:hypothetical protein